METVVVLLMLFGVSRGVETYCDGRQDGAQCYRALGGAVVLQLMDNASEIPRYDWKKGASVILRGRKNIFDFITIENRSTFIPSNGTLKINNLSRTDSGEYTLTLFNLDGQKTGERTLKLSVEAPVSSVQLVSECLSQGQMNVTCSSEGGDSPQYSWTLDGHTLIDTELLCGSKETNIITLKQHVSGRLVCSVRNHVSSVSKEENISNCGFIFINCTSNGTHITKWVFKENNSLCIEPTTTVPSTVTQRTVGKETDSVKPSTINTSSNQTVSPSTEEPWFIKQLPIIAGVLSALVILLVVGIVTICAQKKKQNNKEEEDDQDIIYADVRMVQRRGRPVEQRAEAEVEYGQVKFSERPRQAESAAEDVYAKVRKGR
ncbi:T-cell surface antigen CD2-like isoform 2-T3 [Odontesthes bonariensis]|uniref:T-cell surface antigen CD2-like isoform X2 n=1 Tax=Odontesthes bonariensis TaxID=219752 RepID=UPI003F588D5B